MTYEDAKETWWFKLITGYPIIKRIDNAIEFVKDLINKNNPYSSHRAINLTWGIGSFILYWIDHFLKKRNFTNGDFLFIAGMAGVTTISAVLAKSQDSKLTDMASETEDETKEEKTETNKEQEN